MTIGTFANDQLTTPLIEVIQSEGIFPSPGSAAASDNTVGLIRTFAGAQSPGGLATNGQPLSISQNSALFSLIGTNYGGNGQTTFDSPNLQGTMPVGVNGQPGQTTGTDQIQLTAGQLPPNLGGQSLPVATQQTSQSVIYLICTNGNFPSEGATPNGAFIGEVVPYAGSTGDIPSGYTIANGGTLNIAGNTALFSILGTTYGGNGTTTFALPNLTGRDIVGAGPTLAVGTVVGQSAVTLSNANAPIADGGQGAPFNVQSPGLALNYIISTSGVFPDPNPGANLSGTQYVGEIKAFAGEVNAVPGGWLLADGQSLPIATNEVLYETIGTTYGGDGVTTFKLPNLQNGVVSGVGMRSGTVYAEGDQFGSDAAILNVTCFAGGTRIRAMRGGAIVDVAVEDLAIGDLAVTASGKHRSISWLGHRTVECRNHRHPNEAHPIRIVTHAFGPDRPARNLFVSPGHAICVDLLGEVLLPAGALVNGSTIVQQHVESVTYWHVELEGGHDILLAENLPSESYLEMGNRGFFAESGVVSLDASPDAGAVTHADFCRPFHADGQVVAFVRERLAARAQQLGWRLVHEPFADLHLVVDGRRIEPKTACSSACFFIPSGAASIWIASDTSVPAHVGAGDDLRVLGVCVGSLVVDDGFGTPRAFDADNPMLRVGFHALEDGLQRWTGGRALLPAEMWRDCRGSFFLRVELTRSALPRWIGPSPLTCAEATSRRDHRLNSV